MAKSFGTQHRNAAETDGMQTDRGVEFLGLYTPVQMRIHAYIRVLIHNPSEASDVFQETSLVLWRRFSSFEEDGDFLMWAIGVARRQVLSHWRKKTRDRRVFSERLLDSLATEAAQMACESGASHDALNHCIQKLTDRQRDLIRCFYGEGRAAETIATSWGCSVHAVYKALKVMKRALFLCVEDRLAKGCDT